jgi:hypothetical protein
MSIEAPVRLNTMAIKVTRKMDFWSCRTMYALSFANEKCFVSCTVGGDFLRSKSTVGKTIKEMKKESTIPADIIHPRLITGWIWEKRRDEKPAIVVMIAKNVGVALDSIVR